MITLLFIATTIDENSIMMDSCECEIIVNDDNAEDIECRQYMNNGLGPCGSRSGMLDYFFCILFYYQIDWIAHHLFT